MTPLFWRGLFLWKASGIRCWMAVFLLLWVREGLANESPLTSYLTANHQSTQLAIDYLSQAQLPTGFFPYYIDFATGESSNMSDLSGPNIVRQAGVAFALSEYYALFPSKKVREPLRRLLAALAAQSIPIGRGEIQSFLEWSGLYNRWQLWKSLRKELDQLGLLYDSKGEGLLVSANMSYERAWPGATALALLAELNYRSTSGDESFSKISSRWVKGLLALHVKGRGIREAPHYLSEHGYVNGETWMALTRYVNSTPEDQEASAVLGHLDDYLTEYYTEKPNFEFYHWGIMAALERFRATGDERFVEFMRKQTAWYIADQRDSFAKNEFHCAKVEGLGSFLEAMQAADKIDDDFTRSVHNVACKLMQQSKGLQILPGHTAITLDDGTVVNAPQIADWAGAFRLAGNSAQVRVDVTAHCLTAMLRMGQAGMPCSP